MDPHPLLYLSALFFGSAFVPRKFTRDLSGPGFGLAMAVGIAASAAPLALLAGAPAPPPGTAGLALLSGLLWTAGNLALVESMARIGMARAYLLFSPTSINQFLAGILLLGEGSFTPARAAGVLLVVAGSALAVPPGEGKKSRVGVLLALLSTLFFGLFYVPLARALPGTGAPASIALLGAGALPLPLLLAARGGLAVWARAGPRNHLLGLSSGLLFTLGQLLAVAAIGVVGLSVGAPVVNGGLVIVSTLWGAAVFREVPRAAWPRTGLACGLVVLGIALIA